MHGGHASARLQDAHPNLLRHDPYMIYSERDALGQDDICQLKTDKIQTLPQTGYTRQPFRCGGIEGRGVLGAGEINRSPAGIINSAKRNVGAGDDEVGNRRLTDRLANQR